MKLLKLGTAAILPNRMVSIQEDRSGLEVVFIDVDQVVHKVRAHNINLQDAVIKVEKYFEDKAKGIAF